MSTQPPIAVLDLFAEVNDALVSLLRRLSPVDWHRPTMCSDWDVKDIAAHLLDGSLRRLSLHRDTYSSPHLRPASASFTDLVAFLNGLNAGWTDAARRLSPQVLIGLLEWSGPQVVDFFRSLDPFGPACFPVAWAGEEESQNWFDVAREYTEKWHHTQQIFEAVGQSSPLVARRLYRPVLETFLRALPFAFRDEEQGEGTAVRVVVEGEAGGEWWLLRQGERWQAATDPAGRADAVVRLPQEIAWKVWTKRRDAAEKLRTFPGIRIEGNQSLGRRVLGMVAVMA